MKKSLIIAILTVLILPATKSFAQEFRYGASIFKHELVNPAYRFENNLVDINALYCIPVSSDQEYNNTNLNLHSQFMDNMGVGLKANYSTPSDKRTAISGGLTYNYNLNFADNKHTIVFGIGGGVDMDKFDSELKNNNPEIKDMTKGYAEIGLAYKFDNLKVGVSSKLMFRDDVEYNIYTFAKYDINIIEGFKIAPIVSYVAYSNYQGGNDLKGIADAGLLFGYKKYVEIGATYASNDIVNTFASVWASDYARIFYSGGIAISEEQQNIAKLRNEIGIRFILGK
ncbi:MAG: hypothetical protein IMY73_01080 [Bacteroidetes bacterium]|nr:hypothetical protein [Bacteroidota bacterium]